MPTKRLTTRYLETVSTTLEREDVNDALVRGLQLRLTSRGTKTWALRYRRKSDGKRRRLTLGTFPNLSLDEARTSAREQLAATARGADPAGEQEKRRELSSFADLATEWVERHGRPNKSPRALRDDLSMLERHVLPAIGQIKASEITKRDLITLLDAVASKPDARNKAPEASRALTHRPNRVFELVRAMFRWAAGRDLIATDPTAGLSAPIKKEKPRERVLSSEEIRAFWLALDQAPQARRSTKGLPRGHRLVDGGASMTRTTALTLQLALVTGQRIGEVTGIARSELDLNDTSPMWTIPASRSKNGEPHRVPLSPLAMRLVREAWQLSVTNPWLFPAAKSDGPIGTHSPTRALERARQALGVADFRVHDLRRTAATGMAEIGVNPHTISIVLNHVSARRGTITGRVYNRYSYDREKRDALLAWGSRLEAVTDRCKRTCAEVIDA